MPRSDDDKREVSPINQNCNSYNIVNIKLIKIGSHFI